MAPCYLNCGLERRRCIGLAISLMIALTSLTGCDRRPTEAINSAVALQADPSSALGVPANLRDGEEAFGLLAATAPSSAGFYFDSTGQLVVRVRDERDLAVVRAAMEQLRQQGRVGSHNGSPSHIRLRMVRIH
jgi:hypothetical protein